MLERAGGLMTRSSDSKRRTMTRLTGQSLLDHSLHASTFLHHGDGPGMFCALCSRTDHTPSTCAMQAITIQSMGQKPKLKTPNQPWQTNKYMTPPPVCLNWNRGISFHSDCRFWHMCTTCTAWVTSSITLPAYSAWADI